MKNDKLARRLIDPSAGQFTDKRTTRRTEITIETREIRTIRIRSAGGSFLCETCREETSSYAPEHVAVILQVNVAEVLRSIDNGQAHLTRNGICGNSLEYLVRDMDMIDPGRS